MGILLVVIIVILGLTNPRFWEDRRKLRENPLRKTTSMDETLMQGRRELREMIDSKFRSNKKPNERK